MNRNLIYLVNPISGGRNKKELIRLISERTTSEGHSFQIIETPVSGNYDFLQELIRLQQITDVIVCGGDGTINQVARSIHGLDINIGVIPMGSGNGLAFAAGIPRDPSKALTIIFKGSHSYIDSFYINGLFSCMLCGLGFDAQVAHDFAKVPKRGLSTYIRETIRNFFIAPVYPFTITDSDTRIKSDAFFICIANSNQFGNNFKIAPKASLSDGMLDIVVVNRMSKLKLLYTIMMQLNTGQVVPFSEKKFHNKDVHYFQARKLSIENPSNAPFHIDGDPYPTSTKFDIEIIDRAFRLLQP